MKTLKTKWTGIRPLVMGNPQTIKLTSPFAIEGRRLSTAIKAARKKQDENKLIELETQMIRNDWESSAYFDPKRSQYYLPDTVIMACIRSGATASKKGRDIDRAVIVSETEAYIEGVKAHRTLEAYFADPDFRLEIQVKIPPKTGSLVWKARTMIPTGWTVTFSLDFDEDLMAQKSLVEAMETAGRMCGVGGWRPKFGRFTVEIL